MYTYITQELPQIVEKVNQYPCLHYLTPKPLTQIPIFTFLFRYLGTKYGVATQKFFTLKLETAIIV